MKFAVILLLSAAASAADPAPLVVCNSDGCGRAVTGTANGTVDVALAHSDCSSFMALTGSPKPVPTYASACGETSRYSSACTCWGIKSGGKSYKRDSLIHLLTLTPASRSLLPQSAAAPRFHPRLAHGYHLLAHVFRPMSSLCCCALTVSPSFQPGPRFL
jgi:hypothetical protein